MQSVSCKAGRNPLMQFEIMEISVEMMRRFLCAYVRIALLHFSWACFYLLGHEFDLIPFLRIRSKDGSMSYVFIMAILRVW